MALSDDMGDWPEANDLASEITHGTSYMEMLSPEPPTSSNDRRNNSKSAPPLNLKNLQSRDSGSIRSKPSSPNVDYREPLTPEGDGNSFAAGSAVNLMRKVKQVPSLGK